MSFHSILDSLQLFDWTDGGSIQVYRKRDPSGGDETEFMENLFDILCSCLSSSLPLSLSPSPSIPSSSISISHPTKTSFLESEGIELMLLLLKSNHAVAKTRALKCLSHALSGVRTGNAQSLAERFVECLGLKTLFSIFMGKVRFLFSSRSIFSEFELIVGPSCTCRGMGRRKLLIQLPT